MDQGKANNRKIRGLLGKEKLLKTDEGINTVELMKEGKRLAKKIIIKDNIKKPKMPEPLAREESTSTDYRRDRRDKQQSRIKENGRPGHSGHKMHCLKFRGSTKAGWRFTWTHHKSFSALGPVDVLVPTKCLTPKAREIKIKIDQPFSVCTEEENKQFNKFLRHHLNGRTHSIEGAQHSTCDST